MSSLGGSVARETGGPLGPVGALAAAPPAAEVGAGNAVESDQRAAPGFVPMFNGTNTAGWFIPFDSGRAVAKNGQILLTGDKKFFLVSEQSYTNFILTADILIPAAGTKRP